VRRTRALIALAVALVALSIAIAACGGGDDEETNTRPAPAETPGDGATPPSPGALPPELLQCFADKGYKIESPAQIHSAPPQVVQECFEILHEGGGAP
jgi:hypothetical protein